VLFADSLKNIKFKLKAGKLKNNKIGIASDHAGYYLKEKTVGISYQREV